MPHHARDSYADAYDHLVQVVNSGGDGSVIGEELFGASDLLESDGALRDAITDPAREGQTKRPW